MSAGAARPLRVLIAANFDRKGLGGRYFNTEHKLAAGFTRQGCCVLAFSDRDVAREATPLRSSRFGARAMARALTAAAAQFVPHLILFGHTDLLSAEDYAAVRSAVPGARLAAFHVDSAFRAGAMAAFAARAQAMDACFVTTGEGAAFSGLGFPPGRLHFMPNPVDPSVETARVFEAPASRLAHDGVFLGSSAMGRAAQVGTLAAALPPGFRLLTDLRARARGRMTSTAFLDALASAAMSPNLPLDDAADAPIHRLYSSDRIAQLLGQGLTAFTHARAALSALYDGGVVEWSSRADLAEAMARLHRDDAERRRIGALGWRLARERTDARLVASFIAAVALGETPPPVAWPAGPLL